ncbi:MAG: Xaa-Pro peptidase family protein [Dehalococcoidales bacterium]|nr:Xaa-Pro peptidase family protein [Dehalococcoidales bacterium]
MPIINRLLKLRRHLAEKEIDAILISQPENRRYLSGFDGSAGFLLITGNKAVLATDFRYIEQGKAQAPDYEIFQVTGGFEKWFLGLINGLGITRLGFEGEHTTFVTYRQLKEMLEKLEPKPKEVAVVGLVESLRAVKETEEIELIRRAAALGDGAVEHIEDIIHPGMTELEIAWEIEKFMREKGSQPIPFEVIVASGPNGALPHHKPSSRPVQCGEPIVLDLGAKIDGYASDLTRTIHIGRPDATFKKVYRTVLDAQLAAMAIISEGINGGDVDKAARSHIEKAGYGEAFGHGLGHGVGLATHEAPRLGPGSTDKLVSNMVFTIEPGIYLPGWGGGRIEDLAVLIDGKLEIISKAGKR